MHLNALYAVLMVPYVTISIVRRTYVFLGNVLLLEFV